MLDSRKYCPQCGSDQIKYQAPKTILAAATVMVGSVFLTLGLLTLAVMRKPAMAGSILNLADLFIVLVIPIAVLVLIMALMSSRKVDHLKFKCQQCGHHWTMSKEEWRQAGDTSAQTKTLSPQEKEEKKAAVESLINQIKKM